MACNIDIGAKFQRHDWYNVECHHSGFPYEVD
jgi:hypothetical protein